MSKAKIFNIQKFCIHDGPGIRTTVFFKGCPLRCLWCHNPESHSFYSEVLYSPEKCIKCGQCIRNCNHEAITLVGDIISQDSHKCVLCENCIDQCVGNAREISGQEYTVKELLFEIEKDIPFYEQSGGGVTFSGGEVLCQIDFATELARACQRRGISVVIDTCGFVPFNHFEKIFPYVDLFLYDLKLMDSSLHLEYTGQDNRLILENLQKLASQGANINIRIPLIEGLNTDDNNLKTIVNFIRGIRISMINLLPYHALGSNKYDKLKKEYRSELLSPPTDQRLIEIRQLFEKNGLKAKIGG